MTKRLLQLITLGLIINTVRLFIEDYYFFGFEAHFFYTTARELSSYVLVVLSFFLLRNQTQKFLTLKGKVVKMDREGREDGSGDPLLPEQSGGAGGTRGAL